MPNLTQKIKRSSYPQLPGNLFPNSLVCPKVEAKILLENKFCKKWVPIYNLNVFFMANLIFSITIIHVQVCKYWYKQPQKTKVVASI